MAEVVVIATELDIFREALGLSAQHHIQTFDAIILSAAAEAGCDVLSSEDMQHGFKWRGVEIVNPFR